MPKGIRWNIKQNLPKGVKLNMLCDTIAVETIKMTAIKAGRNNSFSLFI